MTLGIMMDLADCTLSFVIWCYFALRILPVRRPVLFVGLTGVCYFLSNGLGFLYLFLMPEMQVPLAVFAAVCGVSTTLVLPLLFWDGPKLRRIVAMCAMNICDGAASALQLVFQEALLGAPVPEYFLDEIVLWSADPIAWVANELIYALAAVSLMTLTVLFIRRKPVGTGSFSGPLALLLLSQVVLCYFSCLALARSIGMWWHIALVLLLVFSVAVVVAGVLVADRCADQERAAQLCAMQESRLAGYATRQGESQAVIRRVAMLRHDVRNEVNAALHLATRGQGARAAALLREAADRCEDADATEGEVDHP